MKNKNWPARLNPVAYILLAFFLLLVIFLSVSTIDYTETSSNTDIDCISSIQNVSLSMNGEKSSITLPDKITNLSPETPITITFTLPPSSGNVLYVKTVYCPYTLMINDKIYYEYGKEGSYPSFLPDPPTEVTTISIPNSGKVTHVSIEYKSPHSRSNVPLYAPLFGSDTSILKYLVSKMGFSLSFSFLQIFMGVLLLFVSLFLIPIHYKGQSIFWLGIFALCTGLWTFAECNLTVFLFDIPSLLYIMAFSMLFLIPVPLLLFSLNMLNYKNQKFLSCLCVFSILAAVIAILLQLFSIIPFTQSMYFFHILIPLEICILAFCTAWEAFHNKNETARQFLVPILVLAISSVMELLNYQIRITTQLSSVFQLGIVIFIILTEILGGIFIRNSLMLKEKNQQLRISLVMLEKQAEIQKERNQLMMKHADSIRIMRHDLRHQMAVLRKYIKDKDFTKLLEYVDSITADIPVDHTITYCENSVVNAIICYYAAMADENHITTTIKLDIPSDLHEISDSNLCVVMGNLLENAIEACNRMEGGEKFINLFAKIQGDILIITMDNSFNGKYHRAENLFLSSKRPETGTGLQSILSVAKEHQGDARFEVKGLEFQSSVYLKL